MIKMAAMLNMVKTFKIFFSGTGGSISMKLGMYHRGLWSIIVCINCDLGLTLTYFTAIPTFDLDLFSNANIGFFRKFCGL